MIRGPAHWYDALPADADAYKKQCVTKANKKKAAIKRHRERSRLYQQALRARKKAGLTNTP